MAVNCHALQLSLKRLWKWGVLSPENHSAIKIRKREKEIK